MQVRARIEELADAVVLGVLEADLVVDHLSQGTGFSFCLKILRDILLPRTVIWVVVRNPD